MVRLSGSSLPKTKNTENEGPLMSVGRKGFKYYNELGYIPYNVGINENAARTLEYAYDDHCIYQSPHSPSLKSSRSRRCFFVGRPILLFLFPVKKAAAWNWSLSISSAGVISI